MSDQAQLFSRIGEKIRTLRLQKCWCQETLAFKANIKKLTLSEIELGKRRPHLQTIRKIAKALNVEPEVLSEPLIKEFTEQCLVTDHNPFSSGMSAARDNLDDMDLVAHYSDLMQVFSRFQNLIGPNRLHHIIRNQISLIHRRRILAGNAVQNPLCIMEAQGYALAGEKADMEKAIHQAEQLVNHADQALIDDDPVTIGRHCTVLYVQAHLGYCLLQLNKRTEAIRLFHEVLANWPESFRHDESIVRTWLAYAYSAEGHLQEAAIEGSRALTVSVDSVSARILRILAGIDAKLNYARSSNADILRFRTTYAAYRR